MEKDKSTSFLFDISKNIKQFYEVPVVFLNKKDFSDSVFNVLCTLRYYLNNNEPKQKLMGMVFDFHIKWMREVIELNKFKTQRLEVLTKDDIIQSITFTIDAMNARFKYYQRYMEKYLKEVPELKDAFAIELELVGEMHREVIDILTEKLRCFKNFTDDYEFQILLSNELNDLFNFHDKIYDDMTFDLIKYLCTEESVVNEEFELILQKLVEDFHKSNSQSAQNVYAELKKRNEKPCTMVITISEHDRELGIINTLLANLEDGIKRFKSTKLNEKEEITLEIMSNKIKYLEDRLSQLDELRISPSDFKFKRDDDMEEEMAGDVCKKEGHEIIINELKGFLQPRIFNYLLPLDLKEKLITELCSKWNLGIMGSKVHQSIISIFSISDGREEYNDDLGTFFVDSYGRKIYRMPDETTLYQVNEHDELVPVCDDNEHAYYYDALGRYYIDSDCQARIYKADATASEYMLELSGVLLKVKEERDGVTYYYDHFGRYYINEEGRHIYREEDNQNEYEIDEYGNLVRIRSHVEIFKPCPEEAHVTEEFKYLKKTVGPALKECIAAVIKFQPADPIKYLAHCLINYIDNKELKEKEALDHEKFLLEREAAMAEERLAAEAAAAMEQSFIIQGESDASFDTNLVGYSAQSHILKQY